VIQFLIDYKPKPQARHRNNGKFHYDPSSKDKKDFLFLARKFAPSKPFEDIIEMDITFCYKRPQSHFRIKNKKKILKENAPFFKSSKADLDNLIKFVADSLNGVFYKDDSQIVSINAQKLYGEKNYVMAKIIPSKNFTKFS